MIIIISKLFGNSKYSYYLCSQIMNTKNKISSIVLYVSLLAFVLFAVYILYINQEVFYTAHECGRMADTVVLLSRIRFCRVGSYLGADFLGGNQSIPVTG